jgi:hypothetical protein
MPSPFMRLHLFALLYFTSSLKNVDALRSGKWCFEACELNLNYAEFNDTDLARGSHKIRACQSRFRSISLYLCVDEYCEGGGRVEWLETLNETCASIANTTLPPYDLVNNYPPEDRVAIKRLSAEEALTSPRVGEIAIPEKTFFERAFTTLVRDLVGIAKHDLIRT